MKHTPTPWSVGASRYHGQTVEIDTESRDPDLGHGNWTAMIECCGSNENPDIGIQKAMANARHIVKCVNNHERLVEALRSVEALASEIVRGEGFRPTDHGQIQEARQLLAELEETK